MADEKEQINPLAFILFFPFYLFSFMLSTLPQFPIFPQASTSQQAYKFQAKATLGDFFIGITPNTLQDTLDIEGYTIQEMPDGKVKMLINKKRG